MSRIKSFAEFLSGLLKDAVASISQWSWTQRLIAAATTIAVLAVIFFVDLPGVEQLRTWADGAGSWFIALFWLCYVILTLFPLPRTIWTVSAGVLFGPVTGLAISRSEEHTSELQSRFDLVCRLLLEII